MPFTENGWVEQYEHAECPYCMATLINTPVCPSCLDLLEPEDEDLEDEDGAR